MSELLESAPFARFLGIEVDEFDSGTRYRLDERDALVGNMMLPALHGGAMAAFLELCCAAELTKVAGLNRPPRPISINLQYISSARRLTTFASTRIIRVGRRVAVVHAEAWQEDPCARVCAAQCEFRVEKSSR